jgi:prepilin-type N-terminal cleavage/methylation domain-containing protein
MINKIKKQAGFTILETIVAIMVLSLSISGAFSAVQQGLSQSIIAKDEVSAFYLAQEAIEIIRNKRDSNQLFRIENPGTPNTWLYGIAQDATDPCYFDKICQTDAISTNFSYCGVSWDSCSVLKQDSNSYIYGYGSGSDTNFKREIQIERVRDDINGNPVEIAVTVRVSWFKGLLPFRFEAKTILLNWI